MKELKHQTLELSAVVGVRENEKSDLRLDRHLSAQILLAVLLEIGNVVLVGTDQQSLGKVLDLPHLARVNETQQLSADLVVDIADGDLALFSLPIGFISKHRSKHKRAGSEDRLVGSKFAHFFTAGRREAEREIVLTALLQQTTEIREQFGRH